MSGSLCSSGIRLYSLECKSNRGRNPRRAPPTRRPGRAGGVARRLERCRYCENRAGWKGPIQRSRGRRVYAADHVERIQPRRARDCDRGTRADTEDGIGCKVFCSGGLWPLVSDYRSPLQKRGKVIVKNKRVKAPRLSQRVLRWRQRLAGRKLGNIVADIRELRGA